ncbi:MAG: hypothetical protein LAO07_19005 [Acidobacteriia bacterium]|nr:hypothetical protein [Terriglobia bacterium]
MPHRVRIGDFQVGGGQPLFLIAGPCVIESERHAIKMAGRLSATTRALGVPYIFKASYDKANRTSLDSYRGPGLDRGQRGGGLRALDRQPAADVAGEQRLSADRSVHAHDQVMTGRAGRAGPRA